MREETTVFQHPHWPDVELPEGDFVRMLRLVDALDPQQLQRLYCKIASKVPTTETLDTRHPHRDTLPPPPVGRVVRSDPPPEARASERYVDLNIQWDDEEDGTDPGL